MSSTTAEKIWSVLIERNPGEEPAILATRASEIAESVAKEGAARQEATGVVVPEELLEAALIALVKGGVPDAVLASRACEHAQAMVQTRPPFSFAIL